MAALELFLADGGVEEGLSPEPVLDVSEGLPGVGSLGLPKLGRLGSAGALDVLPDASELLAGVLLGVWSLGLPKLGRLGSAGAVCAAFGSDAGDVLEGCWAEVCWAEECWEPIARVKIAARPR